MKKRYCPEYCGETCVNGCCRECLHQIAKHSGYDGISIAASSKFYPCADDAGMVDVSEYPYTKG